MPGFNSTLHPLGVGKWVPAVAGKVRQVRATLLCARHVPERLWGLLLGALYQVLYLYLLPLLIRQTTCSQQKLSIMPSWQFVSKQNEKHEGPNLLYNRHTNSLLHAIIPAGVMTTCLPSSFLASICHTLFLLISTSTICSLSVTKHYIFSLRSNLRIFELST